jgi:minor fimbrial subunit
VTLAQKSGLVGVNAICPKGTSGKWTMRSYVTDLPITTEIDSYKYVKLNDYLDGAMRSGQIMPGRFIRQRTISRWGQHPNVPNNKAFR